MNMTLSEENYIKTIYHLSGISASATTTNAIAERMETKASSVTDMLRKLAEKGLIDYKKYQGVTLTESGLHAAKMIVRKHRLWEVFLVNKLDFAWDEVHEIAEQLEHIQSEKLIEKLDGFLGHPQIDPHGDPIPDAQGNIVRTAKMLLSELPPAVDAVCVGVRDSSSAFLQYLDSRRIALGTSIMVETREHFDGSLVIVAGGKPLSISNKIAENIYVKTI